MKYYVFIFALVLSCSQQQPKNNDNLNTLFEISNGTKTPTYWEVIAYYKKLANSFSNITIKTIGTTDSGEPLHLVMLNNTGNKNVKQLQEQNLIILINNGIHPGEPDGIDATAMLLRDYANGKLTLPEHIVLATIPVYNIGGALNRNTSSRTNQDGPEAYGFRGNARNYDLNRDFIKCDTENAKAFAEVFHMLQPDIFIDNHVSNGADYQYTLTHLLTQHNKLGGTLGEYLHNTFQPELEADLKTNNWDITPYVNVFNRTPEQGFSQFFDSPRYSTGYTTLWNTIGLMVETHMLKPYKSRVEGTYQLMKSVVDITNKDYKTIKRLRQDAFKHFKNLKTYPLQWTIDTTKNSTLQFKGYEGEYITSAVTGQKRLKYYANKPYTKPVNYQNYFTPKLEVAVPKAYIIPQGWHDIIALLKRNNIQMERFKNDTTITVNSTKIKDYKSYSRPYEGHYPHYNTTLETETKPQAFRAGDYYISTNQNGIRYLLETLEPQAQDSFFVWNFFDTILQQKEGFSAYVWEDKALELLDKNPKLKQDFEAKKQAEPQFAKSWYAQLDWLHKQSDNYEKAHLQYPVYSIH